MNANKTVPRAEGSCVFDMYVFVQVMFIFIKSTDFFKHYKNSATKYDSNLYKFRLQNCRCSKKQGLSGLSRGWGLQDGTTSYVQLMSVNLTKYFSFLTSRKFQGLRVNYFIPNFS